MEESPFLHRQVGSAAVCFLIWPFLPHDEKVKRKPRQITVCPFYCGCVSLFLVLSFPLLSSFIPFLLWNAIINRKEDYFLRVEYLWSYGTNSSSVVRKCFP